MSLTNTGKMKSILETVECSRQHGGTHCFEGPGDSDRRVLQELEILDEKNYLAGGGEMGREGTF